MNMLKEILYTKKRDVLNITLLSVSNSMFSLSCRNTWLRRCQVFLFIESCFNKYIRITNTIKYSI